MKEYSLLEFPVKTLMVDRYLDPVWTFTGLFFMIGALIWVAFWLAKATNKEYGVS